MFGLIWMDVFATVLEILRVNAGPDGANASLAVAAMERRTAEITFILTIDWGLLTELDSKSVKYGIMV
jgi:hypothetical protein